MKKVIFIITLLMVFTVGCTTKKATLTLEESEINIYVEDTYIIKSTITGLSKYTINYLISKPEIAEMENGVIKGLKVGQTMVTVSIKGHEDTTSVQLTVNVLPRPSITITGEDSVKLSKEITLVAEVVGCTDEVTWSSDKLDVATVTKGVVKGIKEGVARITATCGELSTSVMVTVLYYADVEAPEFMLSDKFNAKVKNSWNKEFNPLEGITVIDNDDGDITDKVVIKKNIDNKVYGVQTIELYVEDKAGNSKEMTREVEIVWDYGVTFIGHGGSYYGVMNSEEAMLYAVKVLQYQALECDVKQTSDGVFVICHDDTFGGYSLGSTPWSVIKDVEIEVKRNAGFPSDNGSVTGSPYKTKICTLERYLEICKQYNAKAVIELKGSKGITNSDQSRMSALMDVIKEANMLEDTIFLGSQYNCLIWTRNNGYGDIPCQYLVNSFESDTILQRCIDNKLDISINVTGGHSNNDEWLAKYFDAGCKVSTFTFTQYVDYPEVQKWIDKGVDFVTCDWHLMSELNLENTISTEVFTVTFKDYTGEVLKTAAVKEGRSAAAPTPTRVGYDFVGWDKDINGVSEDFEVTAQYEIINYIVTYNGNTDTVLESSWETQADFINDFYTDLYNWLLSNGNNVSGISVSGNKVTMKANTQTIEINSVAELKAIDKYVFEKTISNVIYKPVVRGSDDSAVIEDSELYFLNSKAYKQKYLALDAWFMNCINEKYKSYDKTYKPTTDGKIQILFRFHQWQQGTSISSFNTLPIKYDITKDTDNQYQLPTTHLTFTIDDEFDLPDATGNYEFLGWYLDKECTKPITKIEKGTTKNIEVFAKWQKK